MFCRKSRQFHGKKPVQELLYNKSFRPIEPCNFIKKGHKHRIQGFFICESAKVLRASVLKNICEPPAASLIFDNIFFFYLRNSTAWLSVKIQTMSQVMNVFKVEILCFIYFDVIIRQRLKKNSSQSNEVKTCGIVQQLILRMLRDLILQSLNGDPT